MFTKFNILKKKTIKSQKFTDDDFEPSRQSLYDKTQLLREGGFFKNYLHFNVTVGGWSRPEQINSLKSEDLCLYNNPKPSDIVQGAIGSCWYLSSLSLLTKHREYFEKIFLTREINDLGVYKFLLCIRGIWKTITIDDYIPCNVTNQRTVFAQVHDNQLYPALLEKALAKIHGCYAMIIDGTCIEGLQTLTGYPCEVVLLNGRKNISIEEKWLKVKAFHEHGYLMTCLCDYTDNPLKMVIKGLFSKHIYSILDLQEISYNAETIRLLKLRNPWSRGEWKGKWSNSWSHWPAHLKQQLLKDTHKKDGTFWISFDDVNTNFYDITVSKTRLDQVAVRLQGTFQDYAEHIECYKFDISQAQTVEIEVFANGRLETPYNRKSDPMIDLCVVLCQVVPKGILKCIKFSHKIEQMGDYVSVQALLEVGKYVVFASSIKAIIILDKEKEKSSTKNNFIYNIAFHTANKRLEIVRKTLPGTVMFDVYKSMVAMSEHVKFSYENNVKYSILKLKICNAILAENLNKNHCARITLNTSASENIDDSLKRAETKHHLCPSQSKWLVFQVPLDFRKTLNYKIRLTTEKFKYTNNCDVQSSDMVEHRELFSGVYTIRNNGVTVNWSEIY